MKAKVFLFIISVFCIFRYSVFPMEITSPAFSGNSYIPDKYTCASFDFSPALAWNGVPRGTKSFALICDDPDAPFGTWIHWIIFNIPGNARNLEENISKISQMDNGIGQGINSFGDFGYGGPCPPPGKPHRYFFKLYALDKRLDVRRKVTEKALLSAMEGHILEQAQIIGLYRR